MSQNNDEQKQKEIKEEEEKKREQYVEHVFGYCREGKFYLGDN